MALAAEDLSFKSLGQSPIAGGLSLVDALLLQPVEASRSENWRHRLGLLEFRDQLRDLGLSFGLAPTSQWNTATGTWDAQTEAWDTFGAASVLGATGPITRLDQATFRSGSSYLMALDRAHVWSWDGSGLSFLDVTGSSITTGSDLAPWSSDTGGAGSGLTDVGFFADNGLNELIYWSGSGNAIKLISHATYIANTGNPASLVGRYVAIFAGRVFIAFTTESGVAQPHRVRWCSDSDFFDWRTAPVRLGAGAVDCSDSPGNITGMWTLAQQLYIAKSDSIVIGRETGDISTPFVFPVALRVGCLSGQSFQAINPQTGIFLGNDNIYQISGAETAPIGDKIKGRKGIKGLFNDLDQAYARQIVSGIRPDLGLYYLAIPLRGKTEATRVYVYNWFEETWAIEDYPTKIHSMANILLGTGSETWNSISGSWDSKGDTAWDSFQPGISSPRQVVGTEYSETGSNRWRVHEFTRDDNPQDSAAIPRDTVAIWESKLFKLNPQPGPYGATTIKGVWVYFDDYTGTTLTATITSDHVNDETVVKSFGASRQVFLPFGSTGRLQKVRFEATTRMAIRAVDIVYSLRRA